MSTAARSLALCLSLACLAATDAAAQRVLRSPNPPLTPGRLLVSGFHSDAIHVYLTGSGTPRGSIGPVPGAQSITQGPDGLLYACAETADRIVRIDPTTMQIVDDFVFDDPLTPADETGGLNGPTAAIFGPDGDLFVASFDNDSILRYDGATGAFAGVFVPSGFGNLNGPDAGTKFGPGGDLYVPSYFNNRILRYDGTTGAFEGAFVPALSGSLRNPRDLVFHDGEVFVASSGNNRILRYDGDGNFLGVFATVSSPYSLAFNPDDGDLYVVSLNANHVRVFDGATGAFVRPVFANGANGIDGAVYLRFLR